MTKQKLKEAYSNWNKEISKLDDRKIEIFHELQEMCSKNGDGNRWCSIEKLIEELVKKGHVYKTTKLISEYYNICGQQEALRILATATNNFDI